MALRNYSSTVNPTKTAGEIQQLLASYGARRVALDYDEDGQCEAITFMADVGGQDLYFRLEPDPSGTLQALKNDSDVPKSYVTWEQARRTAWRNEKDWVDAQLAKVEAQNARLEQLFLGYGVTDTGETVYERLQRSDKLLTTTLV
jgi:hypothetical protein